MRKNTHTAVISVTIAAALMLHACTKNSTSSTTTTTTTNNPMGEFAGSWKLHEIIFDQNNNGVIDANDPVINEDTANDVITFNINGTYSETNSSSSSAGTGTWSLANNNKFILTKATDSTTTNSDLITAISGTSFTITDTSQHPTVWQILNKK